MVSHTVSDHGRKVFKLCSLIHAFRIARLLRDSGKMMKALELSIAYVLPAQDL
jgi:hypothetical protein